MRSTEERGSWYLLTGLVLGILIGVVYSRDFQPVKYVDVDPSTLRQDFKDQYRALIAAAFLSNGDLVRARARLELLKDKDPIRSLTEQAQKMLAQNGASVEARALGLLAIALGQSPPGPGKAVTEAQPIATDTLVLSTPANLLASPEARLSELTQEPLNEISASPSVTSSISLPEEIFVLVSKAEICEQPLLEPRIQVEVRGRDKEPVPGALVIVTWAGGEERFFTGLKSEVGPGFADFTINPGFVYSLRVGENSLSLGNIKALECTSSSGDTYWGAWGLQFSAQ